MHVETVIEIASDSASPPLTPSPHPKLQTRRKVVEIEEDDDDEEEGKDEDEDDKKKDRMDEDYEQPNEDDEEDDDDESDSLTDEEEILNDRRRSTRVRKTVQTNSKSRDMREDDEAFEIQVSRVLRQSKKEATRGKQLIRTKKRIRVEDEESEEESEEDDNAKHDSENEEENAFVIDKLLACETHTIKEWQRIQQKNTRFLHNGSIFLEENEESKKELEEEEERFLVKWKNLSYIHVSWETEISLLEIDSLAKRKIERFRLQHLSESVESDEYFNPEFCAVDRILDIQDQPDDPFSPVEDDEEKQNLKYFLVKWKATPYNAITWEREDDVHDDAAVQAYHERLQNAMIRYKSFGTGKSTSKPRKRSSFRGYSKTDPPPFRSNQTFELRDYQLTGVNWMLFNWYQDRNSMLADEMGLGKTIQTVTFINHLVVREHVTSPSLIIAPLSTLTHWQREFTTWTHLNAVIYHGDAIGRQVIEEYELMIKEKDKKPFFRFDVLITTYEMCGTMEFNKLARIPWQIVVVDEAHRLKNRNSKLTMTLDKKIVYDHIILLTGTPLQNNVEELWTLLNILDPLRFKSKESFLQQYGELKDSSQVEKLHGELRPFLLRRMKEDVEKTLAPKEETLIQVELTVVQKQYYRAIFEQNTEFLARGMKKAHAPSLMNVLMELRKCCNHPFLIRGMEQREIKRIREQTDCSPQEIEIQLKELLVNTSGKLILLDKLLPRLQANGHRILIFSQFKMMLDILQDYLRLRMYRCERIDGNITGNDRQTAIDRFCASDSTSFIMLLSTRAGGVGINLTAADTVIIYDSDWNPQSDLQAQARCHRIGQTKNVKIYRLLTAKTYEVHMFHQASLKLGLDQAVLGSIRDIKKSTKPISKDEIEGLLKHGAYEMFKEDKEGDAEAASKRFSEESIDQILDRSTKIIHEDTKEQTSSFSKATFVSNTNLDEQVALDDPDFWTKVIGLEAVQEKIEPSPLKKRKCRRQVKSYLQDDSGDEEKQKKNNDEEFIMSSEDSDDSDDIEDDSQQILPPIHTYQFRIADLLTSFGYGRWSMIIPGIPKFDLYKIQDIQSYCHVYLASLIRMAATSFIASKISIRNRVAEHSSQSPPPLTFTEREALVNTFATRFQFVVPMLDALQLNNITQLTIPSYLPRGGINLKADREANIRLLQIDRVYVLNVIVSKLGPLSPLRLLLFDYRQIGDANKIATMIRTGILPPHIVATRSDVNGTIQMPPDNSQTNENMTESAEDKSKGTETTEMKELECSTPLNDTKTCIELASDDSKVASIDSENAIKGVNKVNVINDSKPAESNIPNEEERMTAFSVIEGLIDIGGSDMVTSRWIPVIDDLCLVLYVHQHGWLKTKVHVDNFFQSLGDHALQNDVVPWPTLTLLNRRMKNLISRWGNERIMRAHASVVSMRRKTIAETTPTEKSPSSEGSNSDLEPVTLTNTDLTHDQHSEQHPRQVPLEKQQKLTHRDQVKRSRFCEIIYSFGIPSTQFCRTDQERFEKWRYFRDDDVLNIRHCTTEDLLDEALDLEKSCSYLVNGNGRKPFTNSMKSILGGFKTQWNVSLIQSRRLVHRIQLFRLLRSQILVIPPNHLVDVVTRVVKDVRTTMSTLEFPRWWASPRHDILLLQGVECYGLDDYLAQVWRLPLFVKANDSSLFPTGTWVEDYVTFLAKRCHRLMLQIRDQRSKSESIQRVRDIQNMRNEDPYFSSLVKDRQRFDTAQHAAKIAELSQLSKIPIEQSRQHEGNGHVHATSPVKPASPSPQAVIEDVGNGDYDISLLPSPTKANTPTNSSSTHEPGRIASSTSTISEALSMPSHQTCTTSDISPVNASTRVSMESSSLPATKPSVRSVREIQKRKRMPRAWEVIVIDDSDDDDFTPRVNRTTTRSVRRRRGEDLKDGVH